MMKSTRKKEHTERDCARYNVLPKYEWLMNPDPSIPEMTDDEVVFLQCKDMQMLSLYGDQMFKAKKNELHGPIHYESIRGRGKDSEVRNNYEREFLLLCAMLSVVCDLMRKRSEMKDERQPTTVQEYMNHAIRRIERVKACLRVGYMRLRELAAADLELQMRLDAFETHIVEQNIKAMRSLRSHMILDLARHGTWIKPKDLLQFLINDMYEKAKVLVVYLLPDDSPFVNYQIFIPHLIGMHQRQFTVIIPESYLLNSTFKQLCDFVAPGERQSLHKFSQGSFDLVVFADVASKQATVKKPLIDHPLRLATTCFYEEFTNVDPDIILTTLIYLDGGLNAMLDELPEYFLTFDDIRSTCERRHGDWADTLLEATDPTGLISERTWLPPPVGNNMCGIEAEKFVRNDYISRFGRTPEERAADLKREALDEEMRLMRMRQYANGKPPPRWQEPAAVPYKPPTSRSPQTAFTRMQEAARARLEVAGVLCLKQTFGDYVRRPADYVATQQSAVEMNITYPEFAALVRHHLADSILDNNDVMNIALPDKENAKSLLTRVPILSTGVKLLALIDNVRPSWEEVCCRVHQMSRAGERETEGTIGLRNPGNWCFANSVIQALCSIEPLTSIFTSFKFMQYINNLNEQGTRGYVATAFAFVAHLLTASNVRISSTGIVGFVDYFAQQTSTVFNNGLQQDAQEFASVLVDVLHEDTNAVSNGVHALLRMFAQWTPKTRLELTHNSSGDMYDDAADAWAKIQQFSQSPISAVIRGQYAQKTQCTQCFALSYTFDSYTQLTVELPEGAQTTIEDALDLHFGHELLAASSSAAYKCARCANKVCDADKHLTLWRLPRVLIIHLKRFASNSYRLAKNKAAVEYGCELDVEPFMNYASPETETKYALMAVVVCTQAHVHSCTPVLQCHEGSLNSGHYTCIARRGQRWLRFNDDKVTDVLMSNVCDVSVHFKSAHTRASHLQPIRAYLLIYVRM